MPSVNIQRVGANTAKAIILLDDREWKMFSTICFKGGEMDVCTDSINGFIRALVMKSCGKTITDLIKEETGCTKLFSINRDAVKKDKKIIFTFKCG